MPAARTLEEAEAELKSYSKLPKAVRRQRGLSHKAFKAQKEQLAAEVVKLRLAQASTNQEDAPDSESDGGTSPLTEFESDQEPDTIGPSDVPAPSPKHRRHLSEPTLADGDGQRQKRRLDNVGSPDDDTMNADPNEDPKNAVAGALSSRVYRAFQKAWLAAYSRLNDEDEISGNSAEQNDQDLYSTAVQIQRSITAICKELGIDEAKTGFPTLHGTFSRQGYFLGSDVRQVALWLHTSDLEMPMEEEIKEVVKEVMVPRKPRTTDTPKLYVLDNNGKQVAFSKSNIITARRVPTAYTNSVERGAKFAEVLLTNRRGYDRCISCDHRDISAADRIYRAQAAATASAVDNVPRLSCGCFLDLALLEIWMLKVTAHDDGIPSWSDDGAKKASFNFSEENLQIVYAVIRKLTGLDIDMLLRPGAERVETMVAWALEELETIHGQDDLNGHLGELRQVFPKIMAKVHAAKTGYHK